MFESSLTVNVIIAISCICIVAFMMRSHFQKVHSKADVESIMQIDELAEEQAIQSNQQFPIGTLVCTKEHGDGRIIEYNSETKQYSIKCSSVVQSNSLIQLSEQDLTTVTIQDFYIYPIKACAGTRLQSAIITKTGLMNDRQWLIVNEEGRMITQRIYPKMALICPILTDPEDPHTDITLTAPGMEPLVVQLTKLGEEMSVRVWRNSLQAIDQGDEASRWISTFLADVSENKDFRLVHVKTLKPVNAKYAPGYVTAFSDGYPMLITSSASLNQLNTWLSEKIPMNRFRPNIVLAGGPAFAEESWNTLLLGQLKFRNVKPCDRCQVPNVDQSTGVPNVDGQPKKTLQRERNGKRLEFVNGSENKFYFGVNAVAENLGSLKVGTPVKVLTMKQSIIA